MSTAFTAQQPAHVFGSMNAGNPPQLLSELETGISVQEGEPVHLDVRVSSDSDVRISWLKDGKELVSSSRMHDCFDRGYACLDIEYTTTDDTGAYTCVIQNSAGSVQTSQSQISVISEELQTYDTVAMQNQAYDNLSEIGGGAVNDTVHVEPPRFTTPISCMKSDVAEGEPSRFLGEVVSKEAVQVDWFRDGKPIAIGSRFSSLYDRGMILLDIAYCYPEDSGAYTCVVTGKAGRAESSPVSLTCEAGQRIVTQSNLTESSISNLKKLDDPGAEFEVYTDRAPEPIPPTFKGPIVPPQLTTVETMDAYFEVPVDVGNGHKVDFKWTKDGEPVHFGSRINGKLELNMASLSFKYTLPQDSGLYACRIITEYGSTDSQPAELSIEKTGNINTDTQLKGPHGMKAVTDLEAMLNAPRPDNFQEDGPAGTPSILIQPKPVDECNEDDSISFQLQYEPSTDSTLVVQWYKDGEPLQNGTRFRVQDERGVASLMLIHTIAEDSGVYWCQITNSSGTIESNHLDLKCSASAAIITQSNLLEGSEGFKLIQAIEQGHDGYENTSRYADEEQTPCKPSVDVPLKPTEAILGAPTRFLVKMSGFPTPEIRWFIDGEIVSQNSITKVLSDGGISILEINKVELDLGEHRVIAKATNSHGEVESDTTVTVHPVDYKVPDLKHVAPENPFRKQAQLRRVECTAELNKAFTKAKPKPEQILEMEHGPEFRAKTFRSPEVAAAEELLSKVTIGLRKSNRMPEQ